MEIKSGTYTTSGDGTTTVFSFPHNCTTGIPDGVTTTATLPDTISHRGQAFPSTISWDATNITVTYYPNAPVVGTSNVGWSFVAAVN